LQCIGEITNKSEPLTRARSDFNRFLFTDSVHEIGQQKLIGKGRLCA
jgi:hypothetical protein